MSGAQVTFYAVSLSVCVAGTALVYPGVRKQSESTKNSLLAAFMASALAGTALAFVVSSIVNAISSLGN